MPLRPSTNVLVQDSSPPRSAPTDIGVFFITGLTEKGPLSPLDTAPGVDPVVLRSMSDYTRVYGARVTYGLVYDVLEAFFREEGSAAYVGRVVGPTPVKAFFMLQDAVPAATLKIEASNPGAWGNSLNVAVLAGDSGGQFKLQISDDVLGVLETSPSFTTKSDAVTWAQYSKYIRATDQASVNNPVVVAAQSLATGADDRANVVDAQWLAALNGLSKDLGPGQVSAPGRTTDVGHGQLNDHAAAFNRFALLDPPDTNTVATIESSADGTRGNGRHGAMFWPWLQVPGLISQTTRSIPPCGSVAGRLAKNDVSLAPSQPAAGKYGALTYPLGITRPAAGEALLSDSDRDALNSKGVNTIKIVDGGVRVYGWRSLANPSTDPNWVNAGHARLAMRITAVGLAIMEDYLFELIDGRGILFADLKSALNGEMVQLYNDNALFGVTPDQAYFIDVGPAVNTTETIANREVHAIISFKPSEFAEYLELALVKKQLTEAV